MLLRVFILCLCLNITIYGNWDTFTKSIFKHDLNTILADPLYNVVDVGVQLNKLNKKESDILFKHNADKKFIPASTMKVVLTTVVLSNFGRDYQFKTPVLTDGIIKNHILYGNLYLVGRGDPSLSDADITELVRSIKSKGITQVVGDIVYDDSFLDEEILKKHSNARHYYAPPSALNLNYNQLFCKIGYTSNKIPYVYIKPSTSYAKLNTSLSFIKKNKSWTPRDDL